LTRAAIAGGVAALAILGVMFSAALASMLGAAGGAGAQAAGAQPVGSSNPLAREIPVAYLRLYQAAAQRFGLDWAILAAIGRVECDHGRDPDPSCTREGAVNSAGAGGPMQFIAGTWARFGRDGNGDGVADRWNAADAIYAAASYLRASGAPADYGKALFAYNHAGSYVLAVEGWAARYRAAAGAGAAASASEGAQQGEADVSLLRAGSAPVRVLAGETAALAPGEGQVALVPTAVPATVQAMIVAGNELQQLPYGPDGHPDPRGAPAEDCSSTVNYVLYRSGVRPIAEIVHQNPLAQDYVRWGLPGAGRWVTIYATAQPTAHVFIVIAGLRLDTSHNGTDVGPNRSEDGPRWRILDRLPTWAHWSVRHPPGL
jgi:hypothetical protein